MTGTWWNRGHSPTDMNLRGRSDVSPEQDALAERMVHVRHYMGGGREQGIWDFCGGGHRPPHGSKNGGPIRPILGKDARKALGVCGPEGKGATLEAVCHKSYSNEERVAYGQTGPDFLETEPADVWKQWGEARGVKVESEKRGNIQALILADEKEAKELAIEIKANGGEKKKKEEKGPWRDPNSPANPTSMYATKQRARLDAAAGTPLSYDCCDEQDWGCCGEAGFRTTNARAKYNATAIGFYIHVGNSEANAVSYLVSKIQFYHPGAPVYIMSDGTERYEDFCASLNSAKTFEKAPFQCMTQSCPGAEDRWHPWPFFRRFWDAASAMKVQWIVHVEPDNTLHRKIEVRLFNQLYIANRELFTKVATMNYSYPPSPLTLEGYSTTMDTFRSDW